MKGTAGRWLLGALASSVMIVALAAPAAAEWHAGVAAYQKKDYSTAIKEFQEVTQTNPDYAGAYYMLALAQNGAGQTSGAVANARKAVQLDDANVSYRIFLGQVLVQAEQFSEGYKTLKALPISSIDAKVRSQYALLFARAATKSNQVSEAISVLNTQIKADSRNARLQVALGEAYGAQGDDKQRFQAFKKAFELNGKDTASGLRAATAAIAVARRASSDSEKSRYYADAATISEKVANADPSFDHMLLAGEAALGAKSFTKALTWFKKAKAQRSQSALVHFYAGQCHSSLEDFNAALTELQAALALGPPSKLRTQIYNQMGYVYAKKSDYTKAKQAYTEAGNTRKAAEMAENLEKEEQNRQARQEQIEFERKLDALRHQISELRKIGEEEEANRLQAQLDELEKAVQR